MDITMEVISEQIGRHVVVVTQATPDRAAARTAAIAVVRAKGLKPKESDAKKLQPGE